MAHSLPLIIDCDTGRDDALALWVALARKTSHAMNLAGVVTSYGNVALDQVIENTARVLDLAGGGTVPLLAGAAGPLRDHRAYRDFVLPRQASSGNGLCNLDLPRGNMVRPVSTTPDQLAEQIIDLAEKHGRLDYAILGPATNFASLCRVLGDRVTDYIARVTMLGGRMGDLWDDTPIGDFNVLCDPFALREVLERGLNLRLVTLNTTWPIALSLDALDHLHPQSALAETAKALMIAHTRHFAPEPVFRFHDPAMLLAIAQADCFHAATIRLDDDENSASFGRLSPDPNGYQVFIHHATAAIQDSLRADILSALSLTTDP